MLNIIYCCQINTVCNKLSNNYSALWECHLEPDWLLVFELNNKTLILENTGSHSDLFKS
ncbi:MAG: type II toxin-antitoxin system YafQ family toxin [Candidatus Tisiphia sp.]